MSIIYDTTVTLDCGCIIDLTADNEYHPETGEIVGVDITGGMLTYPCSEHTNKTGGTE